MSAHKHYACGHSTKSPRFRFHAKREAEANEVRDKTRLKTPKASVKELFE